MGQNKPNLHRARYKQDPTVAIDIAYRASERYYQAGCPDVESIDPEDDNWYSRGALSGGKVNYAVTGLKEDTTVEYEYTDEPRNWQEEWDAVCKVKWGRHVFISPEYIEIILRYPDPWWPDQFTEKTRISRKFVPAHIKAPTRPHLPATRELIFDWIAEFIDRREEAKAAAGVRFVGGEQAVDHVKSEIANLFISPDEPDVVSATYLSSRFEISYRFAVNLVSELIDEGKVTEIEARGQHFEAVHLYGNADEWDWDDHIPDDVTIRVHG